MGSMGGRMEPDEGMQTEDMVDGCMGIGVPGEIDGRGFGQEPDAAWWPGPRGAVASEWV